jgi:hypothetical protein
MRQLVETDQRNLSPLPVVDSAVKLQVRKLDLAAARPAPFAHSEVRDPPEPGIEVLALIPQSAGVGDLRRGAPEEYCGKVRDPADVAQRLQDQADRFSATCRAAVDADIGRAPQKIGLPSGLRRDRYGGRWHGVARRAPSSPHGVGIHRSPFD